jgi:hypothetical protein
MVSVRINATETGNKLQQNMAKILMNSSWGRNGLKFDLSHLKHRKYIYFFYPNLRLAMNMKDRMGTSFARSETLKVFVKKI